MLIPDILRLAGERGIRILAITDHFYPFTNMVDIDRTRAEVAEAKAQSGNPIQVLFGVEAEIMGPGRTAGSAELAEHLDFVMAGATHFQNKGITDLPEGLDDHEKAHYILDTFAYAVSLPWVNVIAHPFFVHPNVCSGSVVDMLENSELLPSLESAKANNVALEISRRVYHTPEQMHFSSRFYALCKKVGLKFTMGSDAHILDDIANVRILQPVINDIGLTENDFWLPQQKLA